jgi:L-alanine-DL-glutamate epimerase-like enolase superfamily enzyme
MQGRRRFLGLGVAGGLARLTDTWAGAAGPASMPTLAQLDEAAGRPVLRRELLAQPAIVESIELLKSGDLFLAHARSRDGTEGFALANGRAAYLHPLLDQLVIPSFVGKDARDLEELIDAVYLQDSNYKLSGLAFWCCVAWVEFCLLDLLGRMAGKTVGELLGGIVRREVPMYIASGRRDTTPEEEVEALERKVAETGAKAVKFKVGGRMSHNADAFPGRTEGLIRLARKHLGDAIAIHADGNGSYDPPRAVEIGRLLEEIRAAFFEEPCPFDHLDDTKAVADALDVPIAGGEQETSLRRFRWMIANGAVQVVQPDLHYNGGFIRTIRVARMAAAAGLPITPHVTTPTGYVDTLHFVSCTPNAGPFQEYKGAVEKTGALFDPPIRFANGALRPPTAPGLGLAAGPDLLRSARRVSCA